MPDESILREKARVAVQSGKLPGRRPDRTWGAPGVGDACAVCELPVRKDEMESEIQISVHDLPSHRPWTARRPHLPDSQRITGLR